MLDKLTFCEFWKLPPAPPPPSLSFSKEVDSPDAEATVPRGALPHRAPRCCGMAGVFLDRKPHEGREGLCLFHISGAWHVVGAQERCVARTSPASRVGMRSRAGFCPVTRVTGSLWHRVRDGGDVLMAEISPQPWHVGSRAVLSGAVLQSRSAAVPFESPGTHPHHTQQSHLHMQCPWM